MEKKLRQVVSQIFKDCNVDVKTAFLSIQACKEEFLLRHEHIHCAVLHRAAESGSLPIARFLLDEGAKVDARDTHGNTPLMKAAKSGHLNMTELLIAHGANVTALNKSNESAMRLISLGEPNPSYPKIGQLLLSAGACPIFNANSEGRGVLKLH